MARGHRKCFLCPLAIFQCPLAPFTAVSCNQEGCKKWALNLSQFIYICYFSMITNIILRLNASFKKPVKLYFCIFGERFVTKYLHCQIEGLFFGIFLQIQTKKSLGRFGGRIYAEFVVVFFSSSDDFLASIDPVLTMTALAANFQPGQVQFSQDHFFESLANHPKIKKVVILKMYL